MKTKEIPIVWERMEGKEKKVTNEIVTVKRLTFGERAKLRKECRTLKFVGGVQNVEVDEEKLMIKTLIYGIAKAPFNLDDKTISNLDGNLGENIYTEIDSLNTLDEKKK